MSSTPYDNDFSTPANSGLAPPRSEGDADNASTGTLVTLAVPPQLSALAICQLQETEESLAMALAHRANTVPPKSLPTPVTAPTTTDRVENDIPTTPPAAKKVAKRSRRSIKEAGTRGTISISVTFNGPLQEYRVPIPTDCLYDCDTKQPVPGSVNDILIKAVAEDFRVAFPRTQVHHRIQSVLQGLPIILLPSSHQLIQEDLTEIRQLTRILDNHIDGTDRYCQIKILFSRLQHTSRTPQMGSYEV